MSDPPAPRHGAVAMTAGFRTLSCYLIDGPRRGPRLAITFIMKTLVILPLPALALMSAAEIVNLIRKGPRK